jgi:dolichol-phosphate mannosyltransferase
MSGGVWVVLPTYNEAENIEPIVHALMPVVDGVSPKGYRIVVVDDASPDGTGVIADALSERMAEVGVIHRPSKGGLGPAYVAGLSLALEHDAEFALTMDADFSHDPRDVARLVTAARSGADLVLGSRYVDGGGISEWDLLRRVLSRGGGWYARTVLGIHVRDVTAGFKCFRASALRAIDVSTVRSHGYAFNVELTYRAIKAGLRVVEVPITFRDRRAGVSKMSGRIALEASWRIPQMRLRWSRDGAARRAASQVALRR